MGRFQSSSSPGPETEIMASSNEYPPFNSLVERNPSQRQRKVYARYKTLGGLANVPIPGTLHWAVEVISQNELDNDECGYIWELAQDKGKIRIQVSVWTGSNSTRKELLGYSRLTDREICDHASNILYNMNTNDFNIIDKATRVYLKPMNLAHSLHQKSPEDARAYDMLVRNCQDFAKRLKVCICVKDTKPDKRKRRVFKKTGKVLKAVFVGSGRGFRILGTGFWKLALLSSISNPQFIQPGPGR